MNLFRCFRYIPGRGLDQITERHLRADYSELRDLRDDKVRLTQDVERLSACLDAMQARLVKEEQATALAWETANKVSNESVWWERQAHHWKHRAEQAEAQITAMRAHPSRRTEGEEE